MPVDQSLHELLKKEKVGRWNGGSDHSVHRSADLKAGEVIQSVLSRIRTDSSFYNGWSFPIRRA
jgi:hypothetical protein